MRRRRSVARAVWASSRLDSRIYGWTLPDLEFIGGIEVGPTANWMTSTPDSKYMYVAVSGSDYTIAVDLPGVKDQDEALARVDVSGVVELRPVLNFFECAPPTAIDDATAEPAGLRSPTDDTVPPARTSGQDHGPRELFSPAQRMLCPEAPWSERNDKGQNKRTVSMHRGPTQQRPWPWPV